MIGSDEFNMRSSQPASDSSDDFSDMDYIETFLATSGGMHESGLLIDIVCPQPPSKRRGSSSAKNALPSLRRTARTNSTEGWRK